MSEKLKSVNTIDIHKNEKNCGKLIITDHPDDESLVIMEFNGEKYDVVAENMKRAIENAHSASIINSTK